MGGRDRPDGGRVVAHVFVGDLTAPLLGDEDAHHLAKALRLRPGEIVSGSDGRGGLATFRWLPPAALEPEGEPQFATAPTPALTVALALTKGDHPEWAVQKLTEVGADRIVVMSSERCVARWPAEGVGRQVERLRKVARQAAMQSRRRWLPEVDGVVPFASVARDYPAAALAVPGAAPLTLSTPTVLIGPEGGWSDEELATVPTHVGLGPNVLRAETAAMATGVLLTALRAGLAPGC